MQNERRYAEKEFEDDGDSAAAWLDKEDRNEVSGKVSQLVRIVESEQAKNPKLKAIVFVKDRSVATYLKQILDFMFVRSSKKLNEASLMSMFHDSIRDPDFNRVNYDNPNPKFRCNFAIGF